ncbi:MAG: lysophospholipid acyltransferase family protein [Chloroflexi bacterium]|nr:lysophospholipid acyltransferase family protein [Chloroflexota bacterium]
MNSAPASDESVGHLDERPAGMTDPFRRRPPLRIRLLESAVRVLPRLPRLPLILAAELAGEVRYRLQPVVAARARANLRRVCTWLADNDRATPRVLRAAADPAALEGLVRSAFRHHARTYLEALLLPSLADDELERLVALAEPAIVHEAMRPGHPAILVGLHLGPIELQALTVRRRTGASTTTPMESVADPDLQAWFERSRKAAGVRVVALGAARRELLAALRRGEVVGLVADRDITGGGMPVELFGAPATLPIGPALLAVESGAPVYVGAIRRIGRDRYRGDLIALDAPADDRRRERVLALLHAEARAFERLIAPAPDQWWSVLFPIWPDLEPAAVAEAHRA